MQILDGNFNGCGKSASLFFSKIDSVLLEMLELQTKYDFDNDFTPNERAKAAKGAALMLNSSSYTLAKLMGNGNFSLLPNSETQKK